MCPLRRTAATQQYSVGLSSARPSERLGGRKNDAIKATSLPSFLRLVDRRSVSRSSFAKREEHSIYDTTLLILHL